MVTRSHATGQGVFRQQGSAPPGKAKGVRGIVATGLFVILFLGLQAGVLSAAERRNAVVEAVEKAGPAVVNIRTEQVVRRGGSNPFGFSDPLFEEFFQNLVPSQTFKTQSLGSGIIIDPRGYILTNAHVVEKASKIYVALSDQSKEIEASLVGEAAYIDLAVLKIKGEKKYPFLKIGRSGDLLIGETVIAIGNPLGLGHSVTTGVISAAIRRIPMEDKIFSVFIQTDALINPGNSGGPLININGELIGINTAIARQAQGIGFAIPIDSVKRVLPDLMERGKLRLPYHGIIPSPVGRDFSSPSNGGVLVSGVDSDSPAAKAGLSYGDVIFSLDAIPIGSPAEMQAMLNTYIPGNTIMLKVQHGFNTGEKKIVLAEFPKDYGLRYGRQVFGVEVKDNREGGVIVTGVEKGSPADSIGVKPGDLITEIGGHAVENLNGYEEIVKTHIGFEPLRFLIIRGRRGYYADLP